MFGITVASVLISRGMPPSFLALHGVFFVVAWLYLMVGRFWVDAWQRSATIYAVTSQRVMIILGVMSQKVRSMNLAALPELLLNEEPGGAGVIHFGWMSSVQAWIIEIGGPGVCMNLVPRFDLPGEAREVYEILREAQEAARPHA